MSTVLNSHLISKQLPEFVRTDYPVFVTFLEKYYQWLETNGKAGYQIDALRTAHDIDGSNDYFLELLRKDIAPYFPPDIAANKRLFLKLVNQFYKSNGTPDSIKFLFRAFFDEDIEIYFPKDDILKVSDGKWVLPLALRIDSADNNFLNIEKTILTGQTSKATAVVERVIKSVDRQLGITYIEVYISNIERTFQTGETVTATYNNGVSDVTVSGRLIGSITTISIDPTNRGLFYNGYDATTGYPGDPVTIVGGLNPLSNTQIGAVANVGVTTTGGITDIFVLEGGFGFRKQTDDPGTIIFDFKGGFENSPIGTEPKASLSLVDETLKRTINVGTISTSTLDGTYPNINVIFSNTISSLDVYDSFNVYSMSFVTLDAGGGGYRNKPVIETYSLYNEAYTDSLIIASTNIVKDNTTIYDETQDLTTSLEKGDYVRLFKSNPNYEEVKKLVDVETDTLYFDSGFPNSITGVSVYKINRNILSELGSIGRIKVTSGGNNYNVNEVLVFTGGSGYGANAYISEIHAGNNGIKTVTVNTHSSLAYVIGGEGYKATSLPTISVQSAYGANASLSVSELLGDGESFSLTTSKIGSITNIRISSYGYDYASVPIISLRNADLSLANVTEGQIFVSNTYVYQGTSNTNSTFSAYVDKYNADTLTLRVYNYTGELSTSALLKYDSETELQAVTANVVSSVFYGDGKAKATATFENGLIRYPGIYLNTDGHLSADKRIQDSEKYHNYSYVIKSKTDLPKFKQVLNDISHPIGTKTLSVKIDDNELPLSFSADRTVLTIQNYVDTFNIAQGSNTIISTNASANLQSTINVGDTIILNNASKRITNTVNTISGSKLVYGNTVNFIGDLQDGDTIYLSSGNTVTVSNIVNSTHMYVSSVINVTDQNLTINVIYNEVLTVASVNANTIIANTKTKTTDDTLSATIIKVK